MLEATPTTPQLTTLNGVYDYTLILRMSTTLPSGSHDGFGSST